MAGWAVYSHPQDSQISSLFFLADININISRWTSELADNSLLRYVGEILFISVYSESVASDLSYPRFGWTTPQLGESEIGRTLSTCENLLNDR